MGPLVMLAVMATARAEDCPAQAAAEHQLQIAVDERHAAFEAVHATNWDFREATEDRDVVLAELAAAQDRLGEARAAVRAARAGVRDARVVACEGAAAGAGPTASP